MLVHIFNKLIQNDINRRIFNHSVWILLGNIISKTTLLLSTILLSNILLKEEYGQFGILKSTIIMFSAFAGLELGLTATKYISQYKYSNKKKVENIIGLSNLFSITISFIIACLIFIFSDEIAEMIKAPKLSSGLKITSGIVFFSSLNGIQNGIFAGLEKFKELSINTSIAGVISSVGMIFGAKYFGLLGVIIFFGSNYLILYILNYFLLRKFFYKFYKIKLFNRENFNELKIIWKFSLPAILAALMVAPVTWICNYILVQPASGYIEMAYFDIANQWRNAVLFIPTALSQIALPMLSAAVEDSKLYKTTYIKNIKLNFCIALILVIVLVVGSPIIISAYDKDYHEALYPLIIMFVTTGLIAINNVIGQVIASKNKMWLGFMVNFIWGISLIILSYIFVTLFRWGAVGISLAYLLSYTIHTVIQFLLIKNILKI
ncbi:oligosaccharide flippase family protein [Chryseobacterium taihuense]|uniref:Na+-driven multidrug efflux pump n=1 Tax=Chryseobacterium taihuense TaxID=1141221 RepID=A0ABY0QS70_9FLAO|nr:oligosaccharide flippase family protein [Chryseobacterium taihuense]SDL71336.1 Na+-driven multidrug efflux pump [Chryseobacterium taihuense]